MVEGMDHSQDVERLFSWMKAPMVHYREFAPQNEIADAVSTWPAAHRAAVEAGVAVDEGPGPQGDAAARERLARDRMTMPEAAAQALREQPLFGGPQPTPGRLSDRPADPAAPAEAPLPHEADYAGSEPLAEGQAATAPPVTSFDEPSYPSAAYPSGARSAAASSAGGRPAAARPTQPAADYTGRSEPAVVPAGPRGGLFRGEYAGRPRPERAAAPVADRHDRSLDAVFSRMSGAGGGLPDPRARSRTAPGLGAVFNRLR